MVEIVDKTVRGPAARSRGAVGRPQIDVQRLAAAIAGPGNDTRTWFVEGTVGLLDDRGTFKTDDPEGVFAEPDGCVVGVQIEPEGLMITANWNGISCGRFGFILFPIRVGDDVLVAIPGGDFAACTLPGMIPDISASWKNPAPP